MKQYFIAYRFSGEIQAVVKEQLNLVTTSLLKAGITAYTNISEQDEYEAGQVSKREIMEKAFAKIDSCEGLIVLITSNQNSEGQLIEVGYAYAKGKPIIAVIQNDANSYVDQLANLTIKWQDAADLQSKLEGIKL